MGECVIEVALLDRGDADGSEKRGAISEKTGSEPVAYRAGETIRFAVTVTVDEETTIEGLDAIAELESRGRGFGLQIEGFRVRLFDGKLSAGTHRFEGSAPAPAFPSSFRGEHVTIVWWLRAVADIPWARDAEGRAPFRLAWPDGFAAVLPVPEGPDDLGRLRRRLTHFERQFLGFAAFFLIPGVVASVAVGNVLNALSLVGLVFGGLLALGPLVSMLRRGLGYAHAAPVAVAVALENQTPDGHYVTAAPDQFLRCTAFVEPGVEIDELKGVIQMGEWAEWYEGAGNTRHKHSRRTTIYRRAVDMEPTGEPGGYRCQLPFPQQVFSPTVVDAGGHGVVWRVRIYIRHSGGKEPLVEPVRDFKVRALVAAT